jgi:hypothetical protein
MRLTAVHVPACHHGGAAAGTGEGDVFGNVEGLRSLPVAQSPFFESWSRCERYDVQELTPWHCKTTHCLGGSNPRSREGATAALTVSQQPHGVSIHAPARERRLPKPKVIGSTPIGHTASPS